MGIEGTSCQAGTKLVLQKTVYGIPYQQFYLNGNNKLVSVMCPNVEIGSSTHCQSTSQLELVSEGNGYVWNYDIDNARVETSDCTGDKMFMSVGGGSRRFKQGSHQYSFKPETRSTSSTEYPALNKFNDTSAERESMAAFVDMLHTDSHVSLATSQCGHFGSIVCLNGKKEGTNEYCADACKGKCCVGNMACSGFTGTVCMVSQLI